MSNTSGSETNSPSGSPSMTVAVAQTFKVVLMGDSGVGKTSLIHFYTKGPPPSDMISTIGEPHMHRSIPPNEITRYQQVNCVVLRKEVYLFLYTCSCNNLELA